MTPLSKDRAGFDAIVGNPPFLGGKRISTVLGNAYRDWLGVLHTNGTSNADLVAHFFRRAFTLVRDGGTFGLIATNTIAQGDTRSTGLRWICAHGGEIYHARRRLRWPGQAAVVVSVVHVHKGPFNGARCLDNASTDGITAFFFHRGGHEDPARLEANAGKSFVGSYVLGMGFTFDDTDTKGVASPLAERRRLIAADPHTKSTRKSGARGRSRTAIAGRMRPATRCSRGCWNSTRSAPPMRPAPARRRRPRRG